MTDSGNSRVCQLPDDPVWEGRCYTSGFDDDGATPNPACKHKRTQVIAKDSDAQYVECLECGEILEAGEIEKKEGAGFGESLSDA